MSNSFMVDMKLARKLEAYWANQLGLMHNVVHEDDHGVDIYGMLNDDELEIDELVKIDVKGYRKPLFIKSFDGIFVETHSGACRNPGWYCKKNETTHFIFCIDCDAAGFRKAYFISKQDFYEACFEAEHNCDIVEKEIKTAAGFVLPYSYLEEYGYELRGDIYGEDW